MAGTTRGGAFLFALTLCLSLNVWGAEEEDYGLSDVRMRKFSISLLVGTVSRDFTTGADFTTPYWGLNIIPGYYMALHYRGNMAIMRSVNNLENVVKAFPYQFHRLGATFTGKVAKTYRLYLDTDFLGGLPNPYFSDYYALGAYIGAGLEMYAGITSQHAYYLEAGYYKSDGFAENLRDPAEYLNGVGFVLGWRYYIGG